MINKKSRIFVTGHKGLVGSAVIRRLNHYGYKNILTVDKKNWPKKSTVSIKFFLKRRLMQLLMQPGKFEKFMQITSIRLILFTII
jgi:GDP-L-fucose synthase